LSNISQLSTSDYETILAIVLSVLLFADSDNPVGIFKLFYSKVVGFFLAVTDGFSKWTYLIPQILKSEV
jgi:hypothetical protein